MSDSTDPRTYALFISYSTDPDYALTRSLESFLETFHRLETPGDVELSELDVCVDGSDFSLRALVNSASSEEHAVDRLIHEYLARSDELLVLCSRRARESRWIDEEVRWFLEHRGGDHISLAVTEGHDPAAELDQICPPAALAAGLHEKPWYDLRGFRGRASRSWSKVKQFDDERVRLAADLNGASAGEVLPVWYREQRRAARRRTVIACSVLVALILAGAVAAYQGLVARREQGLQHIATTYELLYRDPSAAFLSAYKASSLLGEDEARPALLDAYRVAVLHHDNRRSVAAITGSGPSHLAGRWKQGEVYTEPSPDGRHRLLVTERGMDGASPPGDVYLVDNESARTVRLAPWQRFVRRVEDVGFDRASERVFVTRQFDLGVYDLAGRCVADFALSRYTKSPVHLAAGYFEDGYVLAGESKGGLWLVDPGRGPDATIELQREFHGDAALVAEIAPDGRRILVVFESGRCALVARLSPEKVRLVELREDATLFAGFVPDRPDVGVTAGTTGDVELWDLASTPPARLEAWPVADTALDAVAFGDDGELLLAVGANHTLFVVDRASGRVRTALRAVEAVDWRSARTVGTTPTRVSGDRAVRTGDTFLDPTQRPEGARVHTAGGRTFVVVEDPDELSGGTTYVVHEGRAVTFEGLEFCADSVETVGDHFWLRTTPSSSGEPHGGPLLRLVDDAAIWFPSRASYTDDVVSEDGRTWVGTSAGLFVFEHGQTTRLTDETVRVVDLTRRDGRTWAGTTRGAFVVEQDAVIRLTPGYVHVRAVEHVGDTTWLLTESDFVPGPAYVVDGYFGRPVTGQDSRVLDVVVAAGRTWLLGSPGLYVVSDLEATRVDGIEGEVRRVEVTPDGLRVETRTTGFMSVAGPTLIVDLESLDVREAETGGG